jgi:hypothetical protein
MKYLNTRLFIVISITFFLGLGFFLGTHYKTGSRLYNWYSLFFEDNLNSGFNSTNLLYTDPTEGEDFFYKEPELNNSNIVDSLRIYENAIMINRLTYDYNQSIFMKVDSLNKAYDEIQIQGHEFINLKSRNWKVLKVNFHYQKKDFSAFCYMRNNLILKNLNTYAFIIPGSGLNQSYQIYTGQGYSYQGSILPIFDSIVNNVLIFIKPNEAFLAWHDGKGKKLNQESIVNWHLNRGGSYSYSYLVQTLAISKWVNYNNGSLIISGISQGGQVAFLNSLFSKPRIVIAASCLSSFNESVEFSGHNQLIGIKELPAISDSNWLFSKLEYSSTKYLFTWGKNDSWPYNFEAKYHLLSNKLSKLNNVSVKVHEQDHIYPVVEVSNWLKLDSKKKVK